MRAANEQAQLPSCCAGRGMAREKRQSFWQLARKPMLFWGIGYIIDAAAFLVSGLSVALAYWGAVGLATALLLRHTNTTLYRRGILAFLLPLFFVLGGIFLPGLSLGTTGLWWITWVATAIFSGVLLSCYLRFPAVSWSKVGLGLVAGIAGIASSSLGVLSWTPVGMVGTLLFAGMSVISGMGAAWLGWSVSTSNKPLRWVHTRVDDVVSLAVWSAFLYSALQWGMAVVGVTASGCYFFCDCWKTLGMLGIGRALKEKIVEKVRVVDRARWQREVLGSSLQTWMRWTPLVVQLSALTASAFWFLQLGGYNFMLPVQIFATMCIAACPCVAVLAEPLALWRNQEAIREKSFDGVTRHAVQLALMQNRFLVVSYYATTLLASAGGLVWLTGQWMQPWQAGLGMLLGQLFLLLNSARAPVRIKKQACGALSSAYLADGGRRDRKMGCCMRQVLSDSYAAKTRRAVSLEIHPDDASDVKKNANNINMGGHHADNAQVVKQSCCGAKR